MFGTNQLMVLEIHMAGKRFVQKRLSAKVLNTKFLRLKFLRCKWHQNSTRAVAGHGPGGRLQSRIEERHCESKSRDQPYEHTPAALGFLIAAIRVPKHVM